MSRKHNHKCVVMAIKIYILYIYIYLFDIAWHTCNLKNHSRAQARPVISMQFDSQIIPFILDVF